MTAHLVIGSIAAALSLILGLFFVSVARAPGWRHYRTFSLIAMVTALYAMLEVSAGSLSGAHWQSKFGASASLLLALASGPLWLRFDAQQEGRSLSRPEQGASVVLLIGCALCLIPGLMIGDWQTIHSSWIEITYHVPSTTWLADIFIAALLLSMVQLVIRYAHRAWSGNGSWLRMSSGLVFTLGEVEEGLTATGVVDWPFLGCSAFTAGILLMAVGLGVHVARNAEQLAAINLELKARIAKRTEDLVVTREALMATERHVALGQLAAGVGHEVNNPLSYVKGNLDYLREQLLENPSIDKEDEALQAIDDALHGSERIRVVVDNLTTYARSAPITGAAQVANAVDVAMRVVRPHSKFTMRMEMQLQETTPVAIDESRLIQVLVNLLINAAQASRSVSPPPTTTIKAWQDHLQVVIEIADHGCGMSPSILASVLQPFSDANEESGIGLFLCRSLIEAADGSISVTSTDGIGTTVQLRLKSSGKDFPSISELPKSASDTPIPFQIEGTH